ncbi:MAG: CHRD domain-containing protein [Gaiellaceae bacterium]
MRRELENWLRRVLPELLVQTASARLPYAELEGSIRAREWEADMKRLGFTTMLIVGLVLASIVGIHALAGGAESNVKTVTLIGYQEATPAGVATDATGTFSATIDDASKTITFELTYRGLSGPALFAHIHFGNRYDSGGVAAFLCGGGTKPACPPGTTTEADVKGTITPADVVGPAAQGIAAGEWQKVVDAMRAGVTYANVHTPMFPLGEIRAQINNENQRQPSE